jgi:hypothetical protein
MAVFYEFAKCLKSVNTKYTSAAKENIILILFGLE